ncbi:MAG: flippase [Rivularia sp. (in: cyanobacteria)]
MKHSQSLKQRLIRGAVGSFGLKIISTGLAFLLNLLLARSLGSEGLGTYALVITWIGLLGLPAKLGFPQLLVRNVAIYSSQAKWDLLRGLIRRAYQITAALSLALAIVVAVLAWLWGKDSQIFLTLLVGLIALPLNSFRVLNQSVMSGLHKVVQGQLPENLIAPLLMLLLTLSSYAIVDNKIAPELVITFYVGVAVITVLIGLNQLSRALPSEMFTMEPHYTTWRWIQTAVPFMVFGALYMVNSQTDVIMLGAIKGAESVGLYVVANKISSLVIFILTASNSALGPNIASLYAVGKLAELERIISKASKVVLFFSCIIAISIFLFKNTLLGLFGKEFLESQNVLVILMIGQLVNAFVGPVGLLLNMSGNEKLSLIAFSLSAVTNIALNYYLIPGYDVEGAALATAISTIVWNLASMIFVIKRLGINPTVVGKSKA